MNTQDMKDARKEWIQALRSERFDQGTGGLRNPDNNTHCCLGVLCEVSNLGSWGEARERTVGAGFSYFETADGEEREWAELPTQVQDLVGLQSTDGEIADLEDIDRVMGILEGYGYDAVESISLAVLNDADVPFGLIADLLELGFFWGKN